MAGSDGEAPDHSGLRASAADRDQEIDSLKAAFVRGRLDRDEFDLRVGQALTAWTHVDLAAVTADIPDEVPRTSLPQRRSGPGRTLRSRRLRPSPWRRRARVPSR
jgi:hypothetical protein